jgi:hypothetical protein
LEEYETFYEFTEYLDKDLTSMLFNYSADRLHNPTVNSCLIRLPGSLNSKCPNKGQDAEVKIIQRWDAKGCEILEGSLFKRELMISKS